MMIGAAPHRSDLHACTDVYMYLKSVLDPAVPEQLQLMNFVHYVTKELPALERVRLAGRRRRWRGHRRQGHTESQPRMGMLRK